MAFLKAADTKTNPNIGMESTDCVRMMNEITKSVQLCIHNQIYEAVKPFSHKLLEPIRQNKVFPYLKTDKEMAESKSMFMLTDLSANVKESYSCTVHIWVKDEKRSKHHFLWADITLDENADYIILVQPRSANNNPNNTKRCTSVEDVIRQIPLLYQQQCK
jgi:hypothetical protein